MKIQIPCIHESQSCRKVFDCLRSLKHRTGSTIWFPRIGLINLQLFVKFGGIGIEFGFVVDLFATRTLSRSDLQKHGLMGWEPTGDYKQESTFPSEMPVNRTEFWLICPKMHIVRGGTELCTILAECCLHVAILAFVAHATDRMQKLLSVLPPVGLKSRAFLNRSVCVCVCALVCWADG